MKSFVKLSGIAVAVAVVCLNIFHALNGYGIKTASSLHQSIIAQGTGDGTGTSGTGSGSGNGTGDNTGSGSGSGTAVTGSDCLRNEPGGSAKQPKKESTRCPNPCQNYYARACETGNGGCSPSFCK